MVRPEKLYRACLDFLFPPRCAVCSKYLENCGTSCICPTCRKGIEPVREPLCEICGAEVYAADGRNHICGSCLKTPPSFTSARSLYHYRGEVKDLLSRLKYNKDESVLGAIRELSLGISLTHFNDCDFIVAVPLHKKRLRERGFNQSVLLAEILFKDLKSRLEPTLLCRKVNTVPQVSLDGKSRRKSLKNVFTVKPAFDISGATVGVVDDVYTTGTTVAECSRILLENGAVKVHIATFARVGVPHRGR